MKIAWDDAADIALGGAFLACGGGGDVLVGRMVTERVLREHGNVDLVPLHEIADDATVIAVGGVGAPSIMNEKVSNGTEAITALRMLEEYIGRKADALIAFEAGGFNSLVPVMLASQLKLPVLDADGMGRAFPEMQMETFSIYGVSATPLTLAGNEGNNLIVNMANAATAEKLIRQFTILGGGGACFSAEHVMDGSTAKQVSVPGTISLSLRLGRCLRENHGNMRNFRQELDTVLQTAYYGKPHVLFEGKVIDVDRQVKGGYDVGIVTLQEFGHGGATMTMDIQNEFLTARVGTRMLATVPDLICMLDNDTVQPITQETLRYGQRVTVMGILAPEILRTEQALKVIGPGCFGIDLEYIPVDHRLGTVGTELIPSP